MTRSVNLPGGRADVRDRATTVAMHMLRRALQPRVSAARASDACATALSSSAAQVSHAATARLFVAIDPPAAVREQLAAWARAAMPAARGAARGRRAGARLRLLEPETMHLTLCFLGARPVQELESIAATLRGLRRLRARSFRSARRCGCRRGARARSRWPCTTATAAGAPARIGRRARWRGAIDWRPERRRFSAHITVARLGRGGIARARARARGRGARRCAADAAAVLHGAPGGAVSLVAGAAGASYEPLARAPRTESSASLLRPRRPDAARGEPGPVGDAGQRRAIGADRLQSRLRSRAASRLRRRSRRRRHRRRAAVRAFGFAPVRPSAGRRPGRRPLRAAFGRRPVRRRWRRSVRSRRRRRSLRCPAPGCCRLRRQPRSGRRSPAPARSRRGASACAWLTCRW